ncbi:DUF1800 domain-containing protein [Ponticoccus sp. SC2-23]|uniref:DUF1800 domain-containing protein n=1 Tax=Alexandriicola marinus TaxID=2081710 RepID=UPI000FDB705F|nr:DUF1800 domain-containing protein [Alexandriicola marinus]MBM1218638.1 DUF1800 domain-containing protein [Ponticoccus sp. SC6-9]MBM1224290.1 DUF1800 domain-containing protein [Ponticoccus sp. SC6-15]MBM1229931.1 DUF1800 domain-containing protein [Ponticoccus sp. SC6-38]MBM1233256.1 DUF1800 domain-containing protein [Ponticoccus sp. SC6-45]MBM1236794.1 DUF1800 domain-containing protein [Ponticoccus sp. SC6-49]MBM1242267.1 DUF1800 domain-containing protein [Ponticoccus sp. SC2-64]MBM1246780
MASLAEGNLAPISASQWNVERAAHLLRRAGFGGTPAEIAELAALSPAEAVDRMIHGRADGPVLPDFEDSGFWEPCLADFPPSRPATTDQAAETGEVMGVRTKPSGPRPLQPATNRFFYWRRASMLETRRVAFWWLDRMLRSGHPLEEKMTLFWHGHFATSEEKVRDYRKMKLQIDTLRAGGLGSFRDLLTAVAKDPAMLVFLDATYNVAGAPNENFGREVMELFTLGVGNYTEHDIREAARAFTGWGNDDLEFRFDETKHDAGDKTFFGKTGAFDGDDILSIILEQDQTATYIATKIYRFFVRETISPDFARELGALFRDGDYRIAPFLATLFASEDFYCDASVATHIMSPTELMVSTYRKLGLDAMPGVPDPYTVGKTLGQILLYPPTVAGWSEGRAWITPGLLFERGNFARDVVFPDMISFVDPNHEPGDIVRRTNDNINAGMEITAATLEEGAAPSATAGIQESFNTRFGNLMGWQEAMRKLKPIPRAAAQFDLTKTLAAEGARTTEEAVDLLAARLLCVPLTAPSRAALIEMLTSELGTSDLAEAEGYTEYGLRLVAHAIMCTPQYQLA